MTIEEKRAEIAKICDNNNSCVGCPIFPLIGSDGECDAEDDECVERIYAALHASDKPDNVNHPAHYSGKHECIEVMRVMFGDEAVKAFCRCNSFKYRFRADRKNGAEDIKKAEWYEDYLFRMEKGDTHDKS